MLIACTYSKRNWTTLMLTAGLCLMAMGRNAPAQTEPTTGPSNAPATQPGGRTPEVVMGELRANDKEFGEIIGDPTALGDPARRKTIAPKAIPLLKKMIAEMDEFSAFVPDAKEEVQDSEDEFLAFLMVFGDADTTAKLSDMAANKDVDVSLRGSRLQLFARWIAAGKDAAAQGKIAGDLETLDKAHVGSIPLTTLTAMFSGSAVSPDLRNQLQSIIAETMNNPAAEQLKQEIVEIRALRLFENKPLIIAAKLSDGKTFTTADWKGKVVLIDFWATWCPPCVAEMPRVKKIYDEYHDKGLEVLGISSDKELDAMKEFVSQNQIAWPQVQDVNPGEADGGPIKDGFGIHGIPVMFLIDKKGILRTVEARDNMDELIPKLLAE